MWNLTADQWASVLRSDANAADLGASLQRCGTFVPWEQVLLDETADVASTLDLGCGRGEHSAVLARAGRDTTLVDWSSQNLAFSRGVYDALGLAGRFCRADITRPLPFATASIDVVFSCGVFEYFNASQVDAILAEAFRVARRRVIIMVPNARAIAYRLGKWYLERTGRWEWGGEVPSHTLRPHFARVGAARVREFSVGGQHSVDFLAPLPGGGMVVKALTKTLRLTRHSRPSRLQQGYLLVTVGESATRV